MQRRQSVRMFCDRPVARGTMDGAVIGWGELPRTARSARAGGRRRILLAGQVAGPAPQVVIDEPTAFLHGGMTAVAILAAPAAHPGGRSIIGHGWILTASRSDGARARRLAPTAPPASMSRRRPACARRAADRAFARSPGTARRGIGSSSTAGFARRGSTTAGALDRPQAGLRAHRATTNPAARLPTLEQGQEGGAVPILAGQHEHFVECVVDAETHAASVARTCPQVHRNAADAGSLGQARRRPRHAQRALPRHCATRPSPHRDERRHRR